MIKVDIKMYLQFDTVQDYILIVYSESIITFSTQEYKESRRELSMFGQCTLKAHAQGVSMNDMKKGRLEIQG